MFELRIRMGFCRASDKSTNFILTAGSSLRLAWMHYKAIT
jgi:hypothetical protein